MAAVLTLVGSNSGVSGLKDGVGEDARLSYPFGIAAHGRRVFIAEYGNHAIRVMERNGKVHTFAGGIKPGLQDGKGDDACFNQPTGVTVDPKSGVLYIADSYNNAIRTISKDGKVETLVGSAGDAGFINGSRTVARLNRPYSVAWAQTTNELVVTDRYNHAIRVVTQEGKVSTIAGTGKTGDAAISVTASEATFNEPQAVAVDKHGHIYVADTGNHVVRKIDLNRKVVVIAGTPGQEGTTDSDDPMSAQFSLPRGLEVDSYGNVYVGDSGNHCIRKIAANGGGVTTIAGRGCPSTKGIDGLGVKAGFYWPRSITMDQSGLHMYIADSFNERIRKVGCKDAIWNKKNHRLFPPANRVIIKTIMLAVTRMAYSHTSRLPNVPIESWALVLSFLGANDWNNVEYWRWDTI